MADANAVGQVVVRGAQGARSAASKAEHGGNAFDVWTHAKEGQAEAAGQTADLLNMPLAPIESGTSVGALPTAMGQQVDALKQAAADFGKAKGALATAGAVMGALTTLEQAISTPLSAIPFPAYPAIRVMDMDVGLPHAHSHPPNLVPPAPPVPLPSTGPVIPIPYVSGAATVLINGMPAGRCGDMGMGIWCGSYFPMYEIFLGSSSVWIEGMRAARLGVDITKHCIFSVPKPQDLPIGPMIGMTISSSANVAIGGVPMPSLTNMAIGAAMKVVFAGLGKVVRGLRATAVEAVSAAAEVEARAAAETTVRTVAEGKAKAVTEVEAKAAGGAPVYRGDGRPPNVIFEEGFQPRGTSTDLEAYVKHNQPSAFVGTSKSQNIADEFATKQGGGHVYVVDHSSLPGIDVNEAYPANPFAREQEIAIPGGVPRESIIGAYTISNAGEVGDFVPNPRYNFGL